jgi:hypothetical protein
MNRSSVGETKSDPAEWPPLIVFDDNEKLLDLQTMKPIFARVFDKRDVRRLFTPTNNRVEVQTRQLEHGGIAQFFERCFGVDSVKRYKPSRETYAHVEKALGVGPSQLRLIACHTWDTLGAVAAGREAALVKRVGNDVLGVGPQPQIVGNNLSDIADQLIARPKGRGGRAVGVQPESPCVAVTSSGSGCPRSQHDETMESANMDTEVAMPIRQKLNANQVLLGRMS